jgi:signal transduction histidine kinase
MKKILCSILLFQLSTVLLGQSGKVDSVERLMKAHPEEDTIKVKLLNELSYQNIGVNYFMAREHAEKALRLAEKLSYIKGIANSNNRLALAAWSLGENEVAIEYALRAVEIIRKENFEDEMLVESYRALGFAYLELVEVAKADFYLHELERIALRQRNQNLLFRCYVGLARLKFLQKQPDSAVYFEKQTSQALNTLKDPFSESLWRYFKANKISDPNLAIAELLKTQAFARNVGNKYVETMSVMIVGFNFFKEKKYAEAEKYMQQGLQLSRAIGVKNLTVQNYQLLFDLKKEQGKFEEAMVYQKALFELRDSITSGKRTRQVIELETRYENEKREQQIKLLVEQKRADTILKYSLLIGLGLVILSSLVVYKLQQKYHNNVHSLLESQKILNHELTKENYIREKLLSVVSHDIKSPLNSLQGIVNMYGSGGLSESEVKFLMERIAENLNSTSMLVDNILSWAKSQLKGIKVVYTPVNVHQLVEEHFRIFKPMAERKHISLVNEVAQTEVQTDKQILSLVMRNLIANAIKFSFERGKVRIYSRHDETGFEIAVADNGKGMPNGVAQTLFDAQSAVSTEGTHSEGGSGLGLSLCHDYLEYIHGKISVQSEPDRGAIFIVWIPLGSESTYPLTLHT